MDDWIQLDLHRVMRPHPAGFLIIKQLNSADPVPLFCVVCGLPNLTPDDVISHRHDGCCLSCSIRWVDLNREKWKEGWRPTSEEVNLDVSRRYMRGFRVSK